MLDDPQGKMATFYNDPRIQKALHVKPGYFWIECMPGAGRRRYRHRRRHLRKQNQNYHRLEENEDLLPGQILLAHDQPLSVVPYVADLLDHTNIEVLIYNGDLDMTTNVQGSEYLLDHMEWNGAYGWSNTSYYRRGLWLPRYNGNDNTTVGGYMKEYKNLHFLTILQSGHLVPFNRPKVAYEMILRFLRNESFIDQLLPTYDIPKKWHHRMNDTTEELEYVTNTLLQHANQHVSNQNHILSWISILFIASIGFVMGCVISRLLSKYHQYSHPSRQGYEIINSTTTVR
jgi:Serine carboxypeptidase